MKVKSLILHWLPRLLGIGAILFVSMFSLDAFEHGETMLEKLTAFGMHMVPSFILALILVVAWKWQLAGGILFTLVGLGLMPFVYNLNRVNNHASVAAAIMVLAIINLPFVIVGLLFMADHFSRRKKITV